MLITCTICVPDRIVWVSDSQQPFVEHSGMTPDVLFLKEKKQLVIPCRVTHPNLTAALVKVSAGNWRKICFTLCPSHPHCKYILCTSSLVPGFPHQSTDTHASFSFSRSFVTLFLSWQPLHHGVCGHLFVSVTGYVWKCVRMCLWVSVLMCWVRHCVQWHWVQRAAFRVHVVYMHVCSIDVLPVNKTTSAA